MNKKLISFLAATAMIVTVSQESMALVGEAVSNGNVAIEQEMESDNVTQEDEVADGQDAPEANTTEDTRVSDTNAVEVSTWTDLNAAITNASNGDTIRINGDIDKTGKDKAITITGKTIKIVAQNDDGSGIKITRDSEQSTNGEFIIESGAGLTLEGDLTIEAPNYESVGMLTHASFINVEQYGKIDINCKITAHTNDEKINRGKIGLIICNGDMTVNDDAKISGYKVRGFEGDSELSAVLIKGEKATLTMTGGEVSENNNTAPNNVNGVAIQIRDGAKFTMKSGVIKNNISPTSDTHAKGPALLIKGNGSKFIMTGGEITSNEGEYGIGIYIEGEGEKEKALLDIKNGNINNNVVSSKNNTANRGGGIYAKYADVSISDSTIVKNGSGKISDNEYSANQIGGGGIYALNSNVKIYNTTISENRTDGNNNLGGAGIYIENSEGYIKDSYINNNQAGDCGYQRGGGILISGNKNVTLDNVEVNNNQAGVHGSITSWQSGRGGGIFISDGDANVKIKDCDIVGNKVGGNPSTLYSNGAGIYLEDGIVTLEGNTRIKENKFETGDRTFGEGISMNKERGYNPILNIKDGVNIKDNDIWLGKETYINIIDKITNINTNQPINITSAEKNIEDEKTEGTKLVEYSEAAGGEAEALKATLGRYFIPSKYMNQDLKIGQSQKTKNVLTYVKELPTNNLPVINASDKEIYVGDNFDPLKDVTATDAEDGKITLTQNNIKENTVDISKPGEYKVTYSVTDSVGATTEKTIKVTVKAKSTGGGGGGTIVTPPTDPDRIEGNDRIETSVETSEDLYPNGTNAVVLANAERYTDVLTADPFAIQEKASALLTYQYEIPEKTLKEIERLGAKKIYISGGYDAVSKKVVDELAAKGYEIFRFDGVDRYDTARKIAIKIREKGNTNAAELASGEDFPDALCMTPLAVKDQAPILLTKKDSVPKYTKQALAEWDIENIKIGGLDEAVSKEVEKQIDKGFSIDKNKKDDSNVYDGAKSINRFGGKDRYETSTIIAANSCPMSRLGVYATGENFPDALIAGNYAGRKNAPVLLVKRDTLPKVVRDYTEKSEIRKVTVIGGVNAVSDKVFDLIKAAINK